MCCSNRDRTSPPRRFSTGPAVSARGLTQPTVYRTLEFLASNGIVQPALDAQKHLVYQIAPHEHHHLICSRCGAGLEIEHELVDRLYRDLQRRSGYRLTDSHLTLFGVCPACRARNEKE